MNTFYFFTSIYGKLCPRKYIPDKMISPARYIIRYIADFFLTRKIDKIKIISRIVRNDVVVSLTSFPARIEDVWKVVCSIKLQNIHPYKIILWLSKEQFPDEGSIPNKLLKLQDSLFEIRIVNGDIKSHKKYYYALQEFPDKIIITVDDDKYYHPRTLYFLLETFVYYPNCIITNIAKKLQYNDELLCPYNKWKYCDVTYENKNLVQIGAGGVLYPPYSLDPMVLDMEGLMKCAPNADDLWLNAMARLNHTSVVKSNCNIIFLPIISQSPSLTEQNVGMEKNDIQLVRIRSYIEKNKGIDPYGSNYRQ